MTSLYELRPFLLIGIGLLAVVVAVVVVRILMRSASSATFEDAQEGPAPPPAEPAPAAAQGASGFQLARAFRQGFSRLASYGAVGFGSRYEVPWCLMLGAAGSRPPDLFADSGVNLPLGLPEDAAREGGRGLAWWFLDQGAVIDLDGDYVLGRDGASWDEKGFRKLLRLLQRHRPRRPLDALVITISARELLEAARGGVSALTDLERRAELIEDRLWLLVRQLGWRCPTSVLITGCEALPGFQGFCSALPASRLGEAVGWSNPHALDAAWRAAWVEDAFDVLGERLEHLKLELLAEGPKPELADGVFLFPPALAELREATKIFLDPLFKPSAYAETCALRGIYLTGELPPPRRQRLFLPGLFEQRVFREKALAAPTRASLVSRNRRVFATQAGVAVLAAVLTIGTAVGAVRLSTIKRSLKPFLLEVEGDLRQSSDARRVNRTLPLEVVEENARHLLEGMSHLNANSFSALFLPSSWPPFTEVDDELTAASVGAYEEVIFGALRGELVKKAERLTRRLEERSHRFVAWPEDTVETEEVAGAAGELPPLALRLKPVDSSPELAAWREWLEELGQLEHHADLYNRLPTTHDLHQLGALVDYLIGFQLPKSFFDHSRLFRQALARVDYQPFDLTVYQLDGRARGHAVAEDFYRRLGPENELLGSLSALSGQLDDLAQAGAWRTVDPAELKVVVRAIGEIETALSQTELDWAFADAWDLGAKHAGALKLTAASIVLGSDLAEDIETEGKEYWQDLRGELVRQSSLLTGPLLASNGSQPMMQISADLAILKTALESFLGESFVQTVELRRILRAVPAGQRLVWDASMLDEASKLATAWDRFENETLRLFPNELRRQVADAARLRLGERMDDLVARAQNLVEEPPAGSALLHEPDLAREVADFQLATEALSKVVGSYERLRQIDSAEAVTELANSQAESLLAAVDRLLEAEAPYRPKKGGFGWWDGTPPVAFAAYEVGDPAELGLYLELERQRVADIARRYAEPLLSWLGRNGVARRPEARGLYLRWEGILLSLKQYEGKKPGNPVSALEEMVLGDFTKVTPTTCGFAPAATARGSGNFFLMRRDELARDLAERCGVLVGEHARLRWRDLGRVFNDRLAGRFPFAGPIREGQRRDAEIADLRAFFRLFASSRAEILAAEKVEPPAFGSAQEEVLRFMAEMAAVESFFSSLLASPELEPDFPVEVNVDFRVNQPPQDPAEREALAASPEVELGGDRIIDWSLASGEQRVTHRDAERVVAWRPGLPVMLTLRWAGDSPRLPEARWFTADGETVLYRYEGRWSLLALLSDYLSRRDPRLHTLRLVIPTEPNPLATASGGDEPPTRVFVRLRLAVPAGEGKPPQNLTLPRFPLAAPSAPEPVTPTEEPREAP